MFKSTTVMLSIEKYVQEEGIIKVGRSEEHVPVESSVSAAPAVESVGRD